MRKSAMESQDKRKIGASRKGRPNKVTAEIKDMIRGALEQAGGQDYLARQAEENPAAFMGLIGKILPKDVNMAGADGGPIQIQAVERTIVKPVKVSPGLITGSGLKQTVERTIVKPVKD